MCMYIHGIIPVAISAVKLHKLLLTQNIRYCIASQHSMAFCTEHKVERAEIKVGLYLKYLHIPSIFTAIM